jgi:hypothetical protein
MKEKRTSTARKEERRKKEEGNRTKKTHRISPLPTRTQPSSTPSLDSRCYSRPFVSSSHLFDKRINNVGKIDRSEIYVRLLA